MLGKRSEDDCGRKKRIVQRRSEVERREAAMLPAHNRYCSSFLEVEQLGRLALRSEMGEVVGETWMRECVSVNIHSLSPATAFGLSFQRAKLGYECLSRNRPIASPIYVIYDKARSPL